MVLLEEMSFDARGNPTAATFKDYLLPSISDIPDFEYIHANTPSKSVGGMRGCGEGGAIIGAPALVNAIADALAPFGEVPVNLPLTPAKLLSVIEGRDLSAAGHGKPRISPVPENSQDAGPSASVAPGRVPAAQAIAPAKAPVDGDWNMVLSTPMGPKDMKGHFQTDGHLLSGHLSSPEGREDFTGTVDGMQLKFDLKVVKPMKITLKYDITVDGDKLTGKVKMGIFGSAKLKGLRA